MIHCIYKQGTGTGKENDPSVNWRGRKQETAHPFCLLLAIAWQHKVYNHKKMQWPETPPVIMEFRDSKVS